MIQEAYCSFDTCKRLKEKRFDVPCIAHWFVGKANNFSICSYPQNWNRIKSRFEWVSMPTLQMACRWLREAHNIHIEAFCPVVDSDAHISGVTYNVVISQLDKDCLAVDTDIENNEYKSYEDAIESGICWALENLIK